ncbi:DUF169 domain-containing protein [Methanobacterium sp.]|uniref:DUF169 domain-containing protein n=1 Tax=Methanobacterium sp. TaxID=2164 RepID=UPI003C726D63
MVKIAEDSIKKIGESFKIGGKLGTSPLAVYSSETVPEGAVPMCSLDRCVAKAIILASINKDQPPLYIGKDTLRGCCPGSMTYLGFTKPLKFIKYFVSTGSEKFRNGEAEYLKADPEHVEGFLESIGEITPLGKYLIIQKCEDLEEDIDVKSIICFGNGEQIRNLSSLIHFRTKNPFNAINMAFGPACATFVTYPAGMAEKAPKETAFVGPVDPTGNVWFPPEYMAIGIPLEIAEGMHEDLNNSFAVKRPEVASPKIRDKIIP